jgi:hypothetical protein
MTTRFEEMAEEHDVGRNKRAPSLGGNRKDGGYGSAGGGGTIKKIATLPVKLQRFLFS